MVWVVNSYRVSFGMENALYGHCIGLKFIILKQGCAPCSLNFQDSRTIDMETFVESLWFQVKLSWTEKRGKKKVQLQWEGVLKM